jgi:hypothetical protein
MGSIGGPSGRPLKLKRAPAPGGSVTEAALRAMPSGSCGVLLRGARREGAARKEPRERATPLAGEAAEAGEAAAGEAGKPGGGGPFSTCDMRRARAAALRPLAAAAAMEPPASPLGPSAAAGGEGSAPGISGKPAPPPQETSLLTEERRLLRGALTPVRTGLAPAPLSKFERCHAAGEGEGGAGPSPATEERRVGSSGEPEGAGGREAAGSVAQASWGIALGHRWSLPLRIGAAVNADISRRADVCGLVRARARGGSDRELGCSVWRQAGR